VYGSTYTKLYLPNSDIDFVITFKNDFTLKDLHEELEKLNPDWVSKLIHIGARVPII